MWCAILHLVWIPFALTLCVCKTRCIQKANAVTLRVQKANTLTLLLWKADAMARIVWPTFALTLCVQKKFV